MNWLTDPLTDWPTYWLTKWGKDWLADWLTDWVAKRGSWFFYRWSRREKKRFEFLIKSARFFFCYRKSIKFDEKFFPLHSLGHFQTYFLKFSLSFACDETSLLVLNGSWYFHIMSSPCCIPSSKQFRYSSNTYDRCCIVFMLLKMLWLYKLGKEIDEISVMIFALDFRWIRNNNINNS